MADVLGPVVAGTFYPADPERLIKAVRGYLDAARPPPERGAIRALIVPHAAYVYSGPVAASAYAMLQGPEVTRVVLIGPSHFARFDGAAIPEASSWATPLGLVPIDTDAVAGSAGVSTVPAAYAREHCLEVQIPFLQFVLGSFTIVPLLTGRGTAEAVADLLEAIVSDTSLLVVSSDLSHYHDYETAVRLDRATSQAIVSRRPDDLGTDSACGRLGVQAALHLARRRGWQVHLLDLRNSGDTAGPRNRVVGYGAYAAQ